MQMEIRSVTDPGVAELLAKLLEQDGVVELTRDAHVLPISPKECFVAYFVRGRKKGGHIPIGAVWLTEREGEPGTFEIALVTEGEHGSKHIVSELISIIARVGASRQDISRLVARVTKAGDYAAHIMGLMGFYSQEAEVANTSDNDTAELVRDYLRQAPKEGKPLFYLQDLTDAFETEGDFCTCYASLDTGEIEICFDEMYVGELDENFDPEEAEGDWALLPDQRELDDWHTMRDFACLQEDKIANELLDQLHMRGAYRRFKGTCADYDILDEYFIYQGERYRQIAIEWVEEHDGVCCDGLRPRS
jgi:hypothetical protein